MIATMIGILIILVIIGVLVYLAQAIFGPIPRPILAAIGAVVILIILLALLDVMPVGRWGLR